MVIVRLMIRLRHRRQGLVPSNKNNMMISISIWINIWLVLIKKTMRNIVKILTTHLLKFKLLVNSSLIPIILRHLVVLVEASIRKTHLLIQIYPILRLFHNNSSNLILILHFHLVDLEVIQVTQKPCGIQLPKIPSQFYHNNSLIKIQIPHFHLVDLEAILKAHNFQSLKILNPFHNSSRLIKILSFPLVCLVIANLLKPHSNKLINKKNHLCLNHLA